MGISPLIVEESLQLHTDPFVYVNCMDWFGIAVGGSLLLGTVALASGYPNGVDVSYSTLMLSSFHSLWNW
ncbi:hypothetical protein Y032_0061g3265 [Ancylostoma ceylanicum]|uniref:Uncharacterized protein n=1 Tax=Ancylostoma ceylanicum TaxID=53326 RepID=A0A016U3U7_9BILA|nr:hypothetical protein Y032_0061g3265 [Ancylostoma ceylanicum]